MEFAINMILNQRLSASNTVEVCMNENFSKRNLDTLKATLKAAVVDEISSDFFYTF